jgi:Flp pilus assembly protein TadG
MRRFVAPRPAQAVVELALVLPVFLLLTLCVVDFARGIFAYNTVSFLARDGARYGTIPSRSTDTIEGYVGDRCESMLSNPCSADIDVTMRGTCGDVNAPVVVRVSYPFEPIVGSLWGGGPLNLEGTSRMYVEQGPPGGCAA